MKILITGSSGHLGEALVQTLSTSVHEVKGIDILPGPFTHAVGSIVDKTFVEQSMQGMDMVLHTATLHKPHVVTHSKQDFIDTNISGTLNLLEAAQSAGVKAFIYTSTTSTFGDAMKPKASKEAVWVTEALVPIPKNIYGATKLAAEDLCLLFYRNHRLPCLVLRTSRFFAEADDDKIMRTTYRDANIKANELLYRRVDIQDVVDAHLIAMEKAPEIGFDRYIISATTPFKPNDVDHLNKDMPSVLKQIMPNYSAIYAMKNWKMFPNIGRIYVNDKAREKLNWQPKYGFNWVLKCLEKGEDYRSPLAIKIGAKGYHQETFKDGPYPV